MDRVSYLLRSMLVLLMLCLIAAPIASAAGYETVIYSFQTENLLSLTIGEGGEVYGGFWDDEVCRIDSDGKIIERYPGTFRMDNLFYTDGLLYGSQYPSEDEINRLSADYRLSHPEADGYRPLRRLAELNPSTGAFRVMDSGIPALYIQSLAVVSEAAVMITVPLPEEGEELLLEFSDDGYIEYGQQLLLMDMAKGQFEAVGGITRPIALYKASDGVLYVYAHPGDHYTLYRLDVKTGKAEQVLTMDDAGYLYDFVYEDGWFVYASAFHPIRAMRMSDRVVFDIADTGLNIRGFAYYDSKIIYMDQREQSAETDDGHPHDHDNIQVPQVITSVRTLNLGADFVISADQQENAAAAEPRGSVSVSSMMKLFNTDALRDKSGISAVYIPQPTDSDAYLAFLASIMAGDSAADIYVLEYGEPLTDALRDQGFYIPLNDSAPVQDYLGGCFGWLREAAMTSGGDIWMLPLWVDTDALWYIPENLDHFGITAADVAGLDGYIRTVGELNRVKGRYTTHVTTFYYETKWFEQYERLYCDYPNGVVNFRTDAFRSFFDAMWTGWDMMKYYKRYHPVLGYDEGAHPLPVHIDEDYIPPYYDAEYVIFSLSAVSSQLSGVPDISDWRALPIPRLSEEIQTNSVRCVFALVNPNGKNRDLAVAYLEAAAADIHTAITRPVFMLEDPVGYQGVDDNMDLPVWQDIYGLFRDGVIRSGFPQRERYDISMDYQAGKITLEEAVNEIQRRVDMWLNE